MGKKGKAGGWKEEYKGEGRETEGGRVGEGKVKER